MVAARDGSNGACGGIASAHVLLWCAKFAILFDADALSPNTQIPADLLPGVLQEAINDNSVHN